MKNWNNIPKHLTALALLTLFFTACKDEEAGGPELSQTRMDIEVPFLFPPLEEPASNLTTKEGVFLGRKLFYEPLLSGDKSMSCGTCHQQKVGFTDPNGQFSEGIDGSIGDRNSMNIMNAAWMPELFWDGRSKGLEAQAFGPVTNPIEMNNSWDVVVQRLQNHREYPGLFRAAFGTAVIDSNLVVKAIAQFERTMVSGNSKYDKWKRGEVELTPQELAGHELFFKDRKVIRKNGDTGPIIRIESGGDCFHCHGPPLFTDNIYHNNGLDLVLSDSGRAVVTKDPFDVGRFKTPTLRNLSFTGPYMHDGRFETLDEVLDFYSHGLQRSGTIDPLMKNIDEGGVQLTDEEKAQLKAFLLTLNDPDFIQNPAFSDPNISPTPGGE